MITMTSVAISGLTSMASNLTVNVPLSISVVLAKTILACPLIRDLFSNVITLPSSIFLTKMSGTLSQVTLDPVRPVYSYVTSSVKFFPTLTKVGPVGYDGKLQSLSYKIKNKKVNKRKYI